MSCIHQCSKRIRGKINLLIGLASQKHVRVEFKVEVKKVWTRDDLLNDDLAKISVQKCSEDMGPVQHFGDELEWNVFVELTNGKIFGVDFVVSATGVVPNGNLVSLFRK